MSRLQMPQVHPGSSLTMDCLSKEFQWSDRANRAGGQPIGELMHQALAYPNLISLAAGFVDDATLPTAEAIKAFESFSQKPNTLRRSLQYGSTSGDRTLRKAILDFSYRDFGHAIDVQQVILTSGSNQLLHLVAEAILDRGDIVITAAPTYFVFLGVIKNMGAKSIGIESDSMGLCPKALDRVLGELAAEGQLHRVKGVYLIPDFDNPTSTTIPESRRREIAEVIQSWNQKGARTLLLADYAYQELAFSGERIAPWRSLMPSADEYTVEFGTFSKSFSPGVRVGWGVFPEWMVETMLALKGNIDFGSPHFNQQFLMHAIESNSILEHLPAIRQGYRQKREAMVSACQEFFGAIPGVHWGEPEGGLYVWVRLPEQIATSTDSEFFQRAIEAGVLYVPGEYCFPEEGAPIQKNTMRLTFGVQSPERIREGIRLLAKATQATLEAVA